MPTFFKLLGKYVFLGALCLYANYALSATFTRDLTVGSTGPDVLLLQQILNRDPKTRLALSGAGSSGNETDYFGNLTKHAVVRFQNLHQEDILGRAGIVMGTGFVGPLTRMKLNSISNLISTVTSPVVSDLETVSLKGPAPALYQVEPYQVRPGGSLVLLGKNFSATANEVAIGSVAAASAQASSDGGTRIRISVPSGIAEGKYPVVVSNPNGSNAQSKISVSVVVAKNPSPAPRITSIEPVTIEYGRTREIVISGENFESHSTVASGWGFVENVTVLDGQKIIFSLAKFPDYEKWGTTLGAIKNIYTQSYIMIVNNGGASAPVPVQVNFSKTN